MKLSRLENGILTVEPKNDDVGRLIKEVDSAMRKKAEAKGLSFFVTKETVTASFDFKCKQNNLYLKGGKISSSNILLLKNITDECQKINIEKTKLDNII